MRSARAIVRIAAFATSAGPALAAAYAARTMERLTVRRKELFSMPFTSAPPAVARRTWRAMVRDSWPVIRPIAWQIFLAVTIATVVANLLRHEGFPIFAPLFAVATMDLICARHHRRAVEIGFGMVCGALLTALVGPSWSS